MLYSPQTGRAYLGTEPSAKKIDSASVPAISELTDRRWHVLDRGEGGRDLNRKLLGWSNYFCLGPVSRAYRAVDSHARHTAPSVAVRQAQGAGVGDDTVPRRATCTTSWACPACRGRTRQLPVGERVSTLVREPDAGNPPVRFDERGVETENNRVFLRPNPQEHTRSADLIAVQCSLVWLRPEVLSGTMAIEPTARNVRGSMLPAAR